jgi:hypothetical protein
LILTWAIERGNILVWVWTISTMEFDGHVHVDWPVGPYNIPISEDDFVIRHDSTKSDKEGEKVHNKAIYWKPFCVWVSGCHWTRTHFVTIPNKFLFVMVLVSDVLRIGTANSFLSL